MMDGGINENGVFDGCKAMFSMGRFNLTVYMTWDYYDIWRFERDKVITNVEVIEVKIDLLKVLS